MPSTPTGDNINHHWTDKARKALVPKGGRRRRATRVRTGRGRRR